MRGPQIKQVAYFIDGFNVYHAIDKASKKEERFNRYKWLNYANLAKCFLPPGTNQSNIIISDIYYFTALASWNPDKTLRHKNFIRAIEHYGIKTVYGKFKNVDKFCTKCNQTYNTYEEKRTDVNIAVRLFKEAMHDSFDIAIVISGDSDLIPSIEAAKSCFPYKQFGVVVPINRSAKEIKSAAHFHMKMKENHLASCRLPDSLPLSDGQIINCPEDWK